MMKIYFYCFFFLLFTFPCFSENDKAGQNPSSLETKKISVGQQEPILTKDVSTPEIPNKISEEFSSNQSARVEGDDVLNSLLENYSWFFEKRNTLHKIGLIPSYEFSRDGGSILSFRLFSYSPDQLGYYLGTSFSNQLSTSFYKLKAQYIDTHKSSFTTNVDISYDNFFEYFYGSGMHTEESDVIQLYAHRFYWNHEFKYLWKNHIFASASAKFLFRKERGDLQNDKIHVPSEFLFQFKGKIGYDNRNSWRDASEGQYHQVSFSIIPSLGHGASFFTGEADLRYYLTFLKEYVWGIRVFVGSSFLSNSSHSLNYILGGKDVFRGFSENRFRGDKIYFAQTEFRKPLPIFKKYLSGVTFFELGEVAEYKDNFQKFGWNMGLGLRIGMPRKNFDSKVKLRLDLGYAPLDKEKNFNFIIDFFQAF